MWITGWLAVALGQASAQTLSIRCTGFLGISEFLPFWGSEMSETSFDSMGATTLILNPDSPDAINAGGVSKKVSATVTYRQVSEKVSVVEVQFKNGDNEYYTIYSKASNYEVIATYHYWRGGMVPRISFFRASCLRI